MADYPLIFLRQLKDMIGIDADYTAQDTRLNLAINTASKTVEHLLGRKLSMNTHIEYVATKRNILMGYDVYGMNDSGMNSQYKTVPLYLKNFPINEDETFEVFYDPSGEYPEESKLATSDYILDAERG